MQCLVRGTFLHTRPLWFLAMYQLHCLPMTCQSFWNILYYSRYKFINIIGRIPFYFLRVLVCDLLHLWECYLFSVQPVLEFQIENDTWIDMFIDKFLTSWFAEHTCGHIFFKLILTWTSWCSIPPTTPIFVEALHSHYCSLDWRFYKKCQNIHAFQRLI